jgi:hypothetical protein
MKPSYKEVGGRRLPEIHDLSKEELEQETRIYRFLHQINIVLDTAKRLEKKGGNLGIQMKAEKNSPLQMEFRPPDFQTITELAVVIEPLVRKSSDIHYEAIIELCYAHKNSQELQALVAKATAEAERIKNGAMRLIHNGDERTPEWIYKRFMDKMVNVGDVEARKYEQNLNRDPIMRDLLLFQFHDYCMNMIRFLLWLKGALKDGRFLPEGARRDYLCIICCRTGDEAAFTKVEHTLPEALGNTHSVLPRGYCCDDCQAMMAPVEAKVVESIPFALTKVVFTKHTKAGRFPSAKLGAVHYEKTKPNHLRMEVFAGKKALPKVKDAGNGKVSFNLTGASKFDHIALGRVLVKAALGGMTLEKGRKYVLDGRFDAAREFIRTGKGLHARLLMGKKSSPNPRMVVQWHDLTNGGAGVLMLVHGIEFVFAATPVPDEAPPPLDMLDKVEVFDLWNPDPPPHYQTGVG